MYCTHAYASPSTKPTYMANISDHFYTGNESFLANVEASIDTYGTSLKKLPLASVNDARNTVHDHTQNQPPQQFGHIQLAGPGPLRAGPGRLAPLTDVVLRAQQAQLLNLFQPGEKEHKPEAEIYLTKTAGNLLPLDLFLPEPVVRTKNPIIARVPAPAVVGEALDSEPETESGWTNPAFKEALLRQVNKEKIFRGVIANVKKWFLFRMALALSEYLWRLYQINNYDEHRMYRDTVWRRTQENHIYKKVEALAAAAYTHLGQLQWVFLVLAAVGLVRLAWPQDQCKDLPLTNQQRRLIGLHEHNEDEADLQLKQRRFLHKKNKRLHITKVPEVSDLGHLRHNPEPEHRVPDMPPRRHF